MLDILCDFLLIQRDIAGGVEIQQDSNLTTASTAKSFVVVPDNAAPKQR